MEPTPRRSAFVTIAAVVAILSGLFLLLCCSAAFFVFLLDKLPGPVSELPPAMRYMMLGTQGFMMCLSILGIATGIGLLYLRKWARVSVLIWGGLFVFFGVIGMLFIFLMPFPTNPNARGLPPEAMPEFRLILLVVYGPPLAIGAWWLFLFSRKSVKSQFTSCVPPADPNVPAKPACPLPISVLAWFYITSVLNLLFLPFFPSHVPVMLFGRVLPPTLGWTVLILSFLALFVAGVGLLKLQPWSYDLTIGLQLFGLASTVVTVLSPNFKTVMDSFMKEFQASLHLPETPFSVGDFSRNYDWAAVFGLVIAGAILGMLVYYRPRFLKEAARASLAW
jgi:hypothetical protein